MIFPWKNRVISRWFSSRVWDNQRVSHDISPVMCWVKSHQITNKSPRSWYQHHRSSFRRPRFFGNLSPRYFHCLLKQRCLAMLTFLLVNLTQLKTKKTHSPLCEVVGSEVVLLNSPISPTYFTHFPRVGPLRLWGLKVAAAAVAGEAPLGGFSWAKIHRWMGFPWGVTWDLHGSYRNFMGISWNFMVISWYLSMISGKWWRWRRLLMDSNGIYWVMTSGIQT